MCRLAAAAGPAGSRGRLGGWEVGAPAGAFRRLCCASPPLASHDVFGYVAFARMGALHGLDPYTHVAAEAFTDPVYPFVGWPFKHSPYGALFTLASYAVAPLGVAGVPTYTLSGLVLAFALALTAGANPRFRAAAATLAAGVGIKLTAGLLL